MHFEFEVVFAMVIFEQVSVQAILVTIYIVVAVMLGVSDSIFDVKIDDMEYLAMPIEAIKEWLTIFLFCWLSQEMWVFDWWRYFDRFNFRLMLWKGWDRAD